MATFSKLLESMVYRRWVWLESSRVEPSVYSLLVLGLLVLD